MAVLTIDLKADGLEQGSFGGVGNVDSPIRVRSINHVALPSDSVDRKFTVSATTSAEGKTLQIEFVGFPDSTTNAYNCDLGWYNSPYTFNLSSYTNTKYVRMLFRYSDDSNITPEEITNCKLSYEVETVYHAHEGEYPINDSAMPIVQTDFTRPFPSNLWRIDQSNDGYPYTDLQLGILTYEPPAPVPLNPVNQRPYVTLYRYDTPQDGFDTHGMFVLTPTKCTITEELNGKYEFSMEHPIDPEGRWQYIRENAIIKAMGQLFTIRVVNQQWKGSSGKIVAKGDHIWYQLGDRWLEKTSGSSEGISSIWVSTLVSLAHAKLINSYFEGDTHYSFTPYIQEGLYVPQGIGEGRWEFLTEGMTPVEFFLGSQGVVAACEGEFHRDNFNFYINNRKHGSSDNAFDIRIGKNLTAIKRTIDVSSLVTCVKGYTNYDKEGTQPYAGSFAVSWTDGLLDDYGIPHHIFREKEFSYNFPNNWIYGDGDTKVEKLLAADVKEWFRQNNQPLIAYEIDMRDVKNNPEYQELLNEDSYKVGDMGFIHDPHIGDIQIEITKSVTNAITGEVEQVVFGNVRNFVGQPPSQLVIDPETVVTEVYFQVMDSEGAFCFDRNGDMIVEYEGV